MSQSKATKIQVRNRPGSEGRLTVGSNTQVLVDGVPLRGCQSIKFECHARKVAKVTLEVLAEVEIDATVPLDPKPARVRGTPYKTKDGKLLAVNTLTSYTPTQIVEQKVETVATVSINGKSWGTKHSMSPAVDMMSNKTRKEQALEIVEGLAAKMRKEISEGNQE